jgi:hypothetical protein
MTGQGHALIAVIVLGFCCLGAIAIDESLSGEQQSTAETGHRDESPHTVHFVTVDSNIKLEVLDWGGSGRAIVLLAGLGNTAHVFDDFAPKLTGTPAHITCTASLGADLAILVVPEARPRITQQIGLVMMSSRSLGLSA